MSSSTDENPLTPEQCTELVREVIAREGDVEFFGGQRRMYWLQELASVTDATKGIFNRRKVGRYIEHKLASQEPGFVEPKTAQELKQFAQRVRVERLALVDGLRGFYGKYFPDQPLVPTVSKNVWRLIWTHARKAPGMEQPAESDWLLSPLRTGDGPIAYFLPVQPGAGVPPGFAVFGEALREYFPCIKDRLRERYLLEGTPLVLDGFDTVVALGPVEWNLAAENLIVSAGFEMPPLPANHGRVARLNLQGKTVIVLEAADAARASMALRRVAQGQARVERMGGSGLATVNLEVRQSRVS
jgi:hypothetical protein